MSWRLAVEQVERSHGVSWGEAAKAVDDACAKGKLRCRPTVGDRPDVLDVDLWRWLANAKPKPRATPKRSRADLAVKALWPNGVPKPEDLPNKRLVAQMEDWIAVYCKRNNLHRFDISAEVLLRAAGRKK